MTDEDKIAQLLEGIRAKGSGCGTCDLCCTLMAVQMAPVADETKPARSKCQFCKNGCQIYERKPDSCSTFMCLWLASQAFDPSLEKELRPDRCGAVIDVNEAGNPIVHLKFENHWQRPGPLNAFLLEMAERTNVLLERPSGSHLRLLPDGSVEELVSIGVNKAGLNIYRTKRAGE